MPDTALVRRADASAVGSFNRWRRLAARCMLGLAGACAATLVPAAQAAEPEPSTGGEWAGYNKTLDGERFSPLRQITPANAAGLAEVCRIEVARNGSFQAGLVVVNGTLYATTPTDTLALDPATCAVKWRHKYVRTREPTLAINRGVAYYDGRLYRGTDDGHVIALDAETGKEAWNDEVGDARLGEFVTGAPVAWNGIIIAGIAGGEWGIRGRIVALDALSGREVWHFNTIPMPGEAGADTWRKDTDWRDHGGGGSWTSFAVDPVTGEVFLPVGNPVPDFTPADRLGQNLYTNCFVVLDARTGKLKWWYQLAPNDGLDHDLGAAPMLFRNGKSRDMVAVAGKDGLLHIVDRITHKVVSKTPVTTVDAKPVMPTPQGVKGCPGVAGGVAWNGPAFDPQLMTIFVGAIDFCTIFKAESGEKYEQGGFYMGGTWAPTADPASGWITAVDANSGQVRWKYHTPAPVLAALTPTAGGVVFGGDNAGNFYVFNSATGEVVKKVETGGSLSGGVISYESAGKQYVAFTAGNVSRTLYGALGRPSVVVMALKEAPEDPVKARAAAADVANGHRLYMKNCFICHGADGKNIAGVDLSTTKSRLNQDALVAWIRNPAPPMPKVYAEPLEPEDEFDIRDIAAYVEQWH
ncbi:MAG: PQQ-binding-like beta-propeller repeat protein [Nevskia sp.]|nr:PQQ-binding-like beta-propeller repeat protein [Nevskia sp.]